MDHQCRADTVVLHARVDRDWAKPGDRRALVDEVTADHPAVDFGDDAVDSGVRGQPRQQGGRDGGIRVIGREIVFGGNCREGFVANPAGIWQIAGLDRAYDNRHWQALPANAFLAPEPNTPITAPGRVGLYPSRLTAQLIGVWAGEPSPA